MFLDSPRDSVVALCPGCGVCSITQKSEIFSEIDAQRPLFYRSKISLNYIIRDFWLQISRKRFNFFENGAKVICSEFNSEPFGPIFEISKNLRKSRFWGKPHSQFCPPPATLLNTLHSRDDTSATQSPVVNLGTLKKSYSPFEIKLVLRWHGKCATIAEEIGKYVLRII